MIKIKRQVLFGIIFLALSSCTEVRERDFGQHTVSIEIFNKDGVKCTCQSSFSDSYSLSNYVSYLLYNWHIKKDVSSLKYQSFFDTHLDFVPMDSVTKTEIKNVSVQLKWEEDGNCITGPLSLSLISITAYQGECAIIGDSTLELNSFNPEKIPEYFKLPHHKLQYNIYWQYSKRIPFHLPVLTAELSIDVISGGITRQYKKSFSLYAATRRHPGNIL